MQQPDMPVELTESPLSPNNGNNGYNYSLSQNLINNPIPNFFHNPQNNTFNLSQESEIEEYKRVIEQQQKMISMLNEKLGNNNTEEKQKSNDNP